MTTEPTTPAPDATCPYCGLDKYEHPGYDFEQCVRKPAYSPEPKRALAFGVYETTEAFKSIKQHSCVCDADTMDLIAVTGPADDELSQKYAELFAAAPRLAARVAQLEAALKAIRYEAGSPDAKQACENIVFEADAALGGAS